ncbi:pitrilysin family protein [Thermotoga sp. KOL6]|uniref:M16 family metallopeptidase n=1 Tax=Thermotoga sp. KOL6 TaxID=126741 RepID=UPI000C790903|nr:pitrilysin family protein [Thermotoga sp. KOL6]PLV60000.1 peptidase M16 [Thermotoga sp. KOL6]
MESHTINGVEVFIIPFDKARTVSCAFLIKKGSVHEPDELAGISHFIEHMAFRGTKNYDHFSLKYTVEVVGGNLNAFTDKLVTAYYAKVPEFHLEKTANVLKEITFHPIFSPEDTEIERKIILEEYKMSQDDPTSKLFDTLIETVWPGAYGRPVIGREETIKRISAEDLRKYHRRNYNLSNTKIVLAGKVNNDSLKILERELKNVRKGRKEKAQPSSPVFRYTDPKYIPRNDLEQVHIAVAKPVCGRNERDFYSLLVLNTALGSGMSSILFHEIREKEGFVYEIFSQFYTLKETGVLLIYAALSPEKIDEFMQKLREILSKEELFMRNFDYGKMRYLGKLEMITDNPSGVMSFVIDNVTHDSTETLEERVEKIKSVSLGDYRKAFERFITGKWSVFGIGPDSGKILERYNLIV